MIESLRVRDIMIRDVITIRADQRFTKADELFRLHQIRQLPVVDPYGVLLGLFTDGDIIRHISPRFTEEGPYFDPGQLDGFLIRHAMTVDVKTVSPETRLRDAIGILLETKFSCLPVVDEDRKLVGIITPIDILKLLYLSLS